MKLTHSYSSLKMFDNCPLRYYRQRIKKDVVDQGGEASIYGERVHKSFEDRLTSKTPLPKELQKHEKLCLSVEKLAAGGELVAEKEMVLNANLEVTGWWEPDAWLRTKLDVFARPAHNQSLILDWKTGKRRPDFFQMELYAFQTFIHYPEIDNVATAFVWLKDDANDPEGYTRKKDKEQLQAKILDKVKRIEEAVEEEVWPAKPGPLCNYCPAQPTCQYAETRRRW